MLKFRDLRAEEIDVRIQSVKKNGCILLLYKDARVDQNILDETVGAENWQRSHELINGNLFCNIGIRVDRDNGASEWVWKQDVGTESNTEKEKGQASDSFKRAAFNWGIGRELYTAPFIWIDAKNCSIKEVQGRAGTYACSDQFRVSDIAIENGKITALTIRNQKGVKVFTFGTQTAQNVAQEPTAQEQKPMLVTDAEIKILEAELARTGVAKQVICNAYHVNDLTEFTLGQYNSCKKRLAATKSKEE